MDFSDVPKIRRQLRQLRAKLSAFANSARDSPSLATTSTPNTSRESSPTRSHREHPHQRHRHRHPSHSPSATFLDLRTSTAPPQRVTVKYGKSSRSRVRQTLPPPPSPSILAAYVKDDLARLASPLRRHAGGFNEYFRELAERVWGRATIGPGRRSRASSGDTSGPMIDDEVADKEKKGGRSVASLSDMAAFAVARNLPLETGGDGDEDVDVEEQWYEYVPERLVLWAHVIELCKAYIPVPTTFISIVDACISVNAPLQAWDLLLHFSTLSTSITTTPTPQTTLNDLAWSFSAANRLNLLTSWCHVVGEGLTVQQSQILAHPRVVKHLDEDQTDVLAVHRIALFLGGDTPSLGPHAEMKVVLDVCQRIDGVTGDIPRSVAHVMALRGSQLLAVSGKSRDQARDEEEEPGFMMMLRSSPPTCVLDDLVTFYSTFDALLEVRAHLVDIGASHLAKRVTVVMLNDHAVLSRESASVDGTILEEAELRRDLEKGVPSSTSKW
ncbi:hypothetical protein HKX48_007234 [Thoreauomyces humboldtii]|nr:hypothetical protein HKX48_007234 [Thoreauomyces humboldtii]